MGDNRLITAVDVNSLAKLQSLVAELGETCGYYKVGMELFYSAGRAAVEYLRSQGKEVFLDLKLHDIPNTVAQGAAALTRLGVSMISLHASGGRAMMEAAVQAAAKTALELGIKRPRLVAITVLTSMDDALWREVNGKLPIAEQVISLARLAQSAGVDGVVASPQEAAAVRQACGQDFLIVTPGIRPANAPINDQSRTATPGAAIASGADYLVVGRPITAAPDRRAAARNILAEMRQ